MRTNRYPAKCAKCGGHVPRNAGKLAGKRGRRWLVVHLACGDADAPAVDTYVIGGREYYRNRNGRCEDAPCCGCCNI